jgi:hypothetical protein
MGMLFLVGLISHYISTMFTSNQVQQIAAHFFLLKLKHRVTCNYEPKRHTCIITSTTEKTMEFFEKNTINTCNVK